MAARTPFSLYHHIGMNSNSNYISPAGCAKKLAKILPLSLSCICGVHGMLLFMDVWACLQVSEMKELLYLKYIMEKCVIELFTSYQYEQACNLITFSVLLWWSYDNSPLIFHLVSLQAYLWEDNKAVVEWLQEELKENNSQSVIRQNCASVKQDHQTQQIKQWVQFPMESS